MNPCPCGHLGDPRNDCRCPPPLVERYRGRVSSPLLDHTDLHVEVLAVSLQELRSGPGEPTKAVAQRVAAARAIQLERFGPAASTSVNAALGPEALRRFCQVDSAGRGLLDRAERGEGAKGANLDGNPGTGLDADQLQVVESCEGEQDGGGGGCGPHRGKEVPAHTQFPFGGSRGRGSLQRRGRRSLHVPVPQSIRWLTPPDRALAAGSLPS